MKVPFLSVKFVEKGKVFRRIVSPDLFDNVYVDDETGGLFLYNEEDRCSNKIKKGDLLPKYDFVVEMLEPEEIAARVKETENDLEELTLEQEKLKESLAEVAKEYGINFDKKN